MLISIVETFPASSPTSAVYTLAHQPLGLPSCAAFFPASGLDRDTHCLEAAGGNMVSVMVAF